MLAPRPAPCLDRCRERVEAFARVCWPSPRRGQERRRFDAAQGLNSTPSAPFTAPTRPLSSLPSSGFTSLEQPPRSGKSRPRTQASPQTLLSQCRSVTRRETQAMKKTAVRWLLDRVKSKK